MQVLTRRHPLTHMLTDNELIFLLTEAKTAGLLLVVSLYSKRALPEDRVTERAVVVVGPGEETRWERWVNLGHTHSWREHIMED